MNPLSIFSAVILSASFSFADDLHWKSKTLNVEFFSEGGSVGDLDGDGHVDLVAGPNVYWGPSWDASSKIYEGKPFSINGYSDNFFSWTWDVDRDGNLDVLVAGFPGAQGWWYKNPGPKAARSELWNRFLITEVIDGESPEFLDITGDQVPELVCAQQGKFGYLEIPKDPTQAWAFHSVTAPGGFQRFTHGLGVGDVNDDGRKDLLAHLGWWEQPERKGGDVALEEQWVFHPFEFTPSGGAQMHAVDLDGDGKNEVVTSLQAHGYGLAVYKKLDSAGTKFERIDVMTDKAETSPIGIAISQLHAVAIADINRDGVPDIVTGKRFWAHQGHDVGEHEPVLLVWIETKRTSTGLRFLAHLIDDDSGVGTQITVSDVNGDGKMDIFSASKRGAHLLAQTAEPPKVRMERIGTQVVKIADEEGGYRPADASHSPLNFDFASGNLEDWSATGSAFFRQPVATITVRDQPSNSHETHWVGTAEWTGDIGQGTMESVKFKVLKSKATFRVAGGAAETTRVEIVDAESKEVLFQASGKNNESLEKVEVDLSKWMNRVVRIRVIDKESGSWGHIHFDDFRFVDP